MKALVCYERATGCMELREVPDPAPAPDEVLVEVAFAGICGSDVKMYHGLHSRATLPVIPGHEFSGVVATVGEAVTKFKPGDRVIGSGRVFPAGTIVGYSENPGQIPGRRNRGVELDGAFARFVRVRERFTLHLPDSVTLREAAVVEPFTIALNAALVKARTLPTHRILISGPGPIGLMVVQLVRLQGAAVLVAGLAADEKRLAKARELGATETVDLEKEDLQAAVARFTEGRGVDVAFECAGASGSLNGCLNALRPYGQHVQVGTFAFGKPAEAFLNPMIHKELTVSGVSGQPWYIWGEAIRLIADRRVSTDTIVTHVFPLDRWREAFEVAEQREGIKVLLTPCEQS